MRAQINPELIQLLKGNPTSTDSPKRVRLPGKYVKVIRENQKSIAPVLTSNHHMLTCKDCGRKGKYDVGKLVANVDKKPESKNMSDYIQLTGYFRCKHCNSAGNWEWPPSIHIQAILSVIPSGTAGSDFGMIGKNILFDGSSHTYATDAEEHFFNLLKINPDDAYLWNRLGNMYLTGNRPDLAASVFEHSIMIDPGQIESHFSLGDMLQQISVLPEAGLHFRQVLLHADSYKQMEAGRLREVVATGLQLLFLMNQHTNGEVPFLPTPEERTTFGKPENERTIAEMELDIFPDETDSFFPLAEMFMGKRAKEIPMRDRTFSGIPSSSKSRKPKKKKVRKKKRRK